jgi:septal ring factor EnvC (AmiA/AmiB activator)
MEFIKKSWKWIIGVIGFFVGLVWFMNSNSSKKVKKLKKNIKRNEKKTKEVEKKINTVKKEKQVTKKKISNVNKKLKDVNNSNPITIKKKSGKDAAKSLRNRLKK